MIISNSEKRKYPRLLYPKSLQPNIIGARASVLDISLNGMALTLQDETYELYMEWLGNPISEKIQFSNGDIYNVEGHIVRVDRLRNMDMFRLGCLLSSGISTRKFQKELNDVYDFMNSNKSLANPKYPLWNPGFNRQPPLSSLPVILN